MLHLSSIELSKVLFQVLDTGRERKRKGKRKENRRRRILGKKFLQRSTANNQECIFYFICTSAVRPLYMYIYIKVLLVDWLLEFLSLLIIHLILHLCPSYYLHVASSLCPQLQDFCSARLQVILKVDFYLIWNIVRILYYVCN